MPWILLAVVAWVAGLLAVPQESFRRLVPFGLIAGFGLALLTNLLGSSILELWGFNRVSWPILGVPFWVLLAWIPVVILFVHFLPADSLARLGWIILFPAAFTAVDFAFLRAGFRYFSPGWNITYSFLLSLGIHLLVLALYLTMVRVPATPLSAADRSPPEIGGGAETRRIR